MATTNSSETTVYISLDSASNHSVSKPEQLQLFTPTSPNSIEQFPDEDVTSISKPKTVNNASMMNCPLPSSIEADDDVDIDIDIDVDVNVNDEDDVSSTSTAFTTITTTTTTSTTSKSVHFSPLVRVKDTLSHHDMSLKEHYACWLQDHEFIMIRQRNQETIQAIEDLQSTNENDNKNDNDMGVQNFTTTLAEFDSDSDSDLVENNNDADLLCFRGLENGLRDENLRRRSYRFAAFEEVFIEQEDQYYAGIYDDEAIAEIYAEVTVECRFRAEFRALQDRKEIEDYLLEVLAQPNQQSHAQHDSDGDEFAI
jgi:hypothetical protein